MSAELLRSLGTKLDLAPGDHLLKAGAASLDIQIPYGSPTAAILEQARREHHSLILMGTQGHGFLHEIFLGRVSHNVARHARPPVLFVPAVRWACQLQPVLESRIKHHYEKGNET